MYSLEFAVPAVISEISDKKTGKIKRISKFKIF